MSAAASSMIRRESAGDLCQILGIAVVITADDDRQIRFSAQHRILPILVALQIVSKEKGRHFFAAVPLGHRQTQHLRDLKRLKLSIVV
jgi:hypothetical protein